jgi:hypothetical protein
LSAGEWLVLGVHIDRNVCGLCVSQRQRLGSGGQFDEHQCGSIFADCQVKLIIGRRVNGEDCCRFISQTLALALYTYTYTNYRLVDTWSMMNAGVGVTQRQSMHNLQILFTFSHRPRRSAMEFKSYLGTEFSSVRLSLLYGPSCHAR